MNEPLTSNPRNGLLQDLRHIANAADGGVIRMSNETIDPVAPDTYTPPDSGWTCFHCGETFPPYGIHVTRAREHFGPTPDHEPGCVLKLKAEDRSLLRELRSAQADLARYYQQDSDMERAMVSMQADHAVALRREEERGYARGVADMTKLLEFAWEHPDSNKFADGLAELRKALKGTKAA